MKARDLMVSPVVTVDETATVRQVANCLFENGISGVPVTDAAGRLVGIVTEADLMRRAETGTERPSSWMLAMFAGRAGEALDYVRSHARHIRDVMTKEVVSVNPETSLEEIAQIFERRRIKRVPVVSNGELVGIVTRANLVQALASARAPSLSLSDATARNAILARLKVQPWSRPWLVNVTVEAGIARLWGTADSAAERDAVRVLAENTPGVVEVIDNLSVRPREP